MEKENKKEEYAIPVKLKESKLNKLLKWLPLLTVVFTGVIAFLAFLSVKQTETTIKKIDEGQRPVFKVEISDTILFITNSDNVIFTSNIMLVNVGERLAKNFSAKVIYFFSPIDTVSYNFPDSEIRISSFDMAGLIASNDSIFYLPYDMETTDIKNYPFYIVILLNYEDGVTGEPFNQIISRKATPPRRLYGYLTVDRQDYLLNILKTKKILNNNN